MKYATIILLTLFVSCGPVKKTGFEHSTQSDSTQIKKQISIDLQKQDSAATTEKNTKAQSNVDSGYKKTTKVKEWLYIVPGDDSEFSSGLLDSSVGDAKNLQQKYFPELPAVAGAPNKKKGNAPNTGAFLYRETEIEETGKLTKEGVQESTERATTNVSDIGAAIDANSDSTAVKNDEKQSFFEKHRGSITGSILTLLIVAGVAFGLYRFLKK
ncbi:hypothetical protein [Foetidibacter luteolus]|uniref:hypothetical protein n=1 Tax=Foetidibacter luteolus TaxID=2608880 RepID=UPI00129A41D1|nr:hypothetical protein [Foetidibacter luteolus]